LWVFLDPRLLNIYGRPVGCSKKGSGKSSLKRSTGKGQGTRRNPAPSSLGLKNSAANGSPGDEPAHCLFDDIKAARKAKGQADSALVVWKLSSSRYANDCSECAHVVKHLNRIDASANALARHSKTWPAFSLWLWRREK
jgi:hypothetical protein